MPRSANRPLVKALPWLVLALGLGVTYSLQQMDRNTSAQRRLDAFNFRTHEIVGNIAGRLTNYEQVLQGAAGLFAASREVERSEFHQYVATLALQDRYPGIRGVGFARLVPAADKARHVEAIRREGFPAYRIWPGGGRDPYTAIDYLEPFDWRNQRAFGYDMYSEPVRRAAMDEARDQDRTTISGKVRLKQESEHEAQPGFLMYLPIYRNHRPHDTVDVRRANLVGWVYAPFRMQDLMQGILGRHFGEVGATLDLEIYDGESTDPARLMFDSNDGSHPIPDAFHKRQTLTLFGHPWTVSITELPGFGADLDRGNVRLLGILAGVLVSVLLALLTWLFANRHHRALALAEDMTHELRESQANLQALFDNMGSGVAVLGPTPDGKDFVFGAYNQAAERIDGLPRKEVLGKRVSEVYPGMAAAGLLDVIERVHGTGLSEAVPPVLYRDERIYGWREYFVYTLPNGDVVAIFDDVDERKRAEAEQKRLNRALRMLSDCNMALVHATDEYRLLNEICRLIVEKGDYLMAWVGFAEQDEAKTVRPVTQYGYEAGYLDSVRITWADSERGRGPTGTAIRTGSTNVNQDVLTNPAMTPWRDAAVKRGYQSSISLPLVHETVTLGALTLYARELNAFGPEEVRLLEELASDLAFGIVTLRTRAEREAAEEKAAFLAQYDPLTHLPNRLLLRDRFELAARQAEHGHTELALFYLDMDNLKQINDSFGHGMGDRLLVAAVERLQQRMPDTATISRLSDDEFAILLADTGVGQAGVRATDILDAFAEPVVVEGTSLLSAFSIGIALFPDDGADFDTLLRNAGVAVSHAKEAGRNTYRFFDLRMNEDAADHLRLKGMLHHALKNGELLLHFQPQIDIADGRILGAEALLRWQHPTEGLVPPARFIPLAEQSGQIIQIGAWVLEEACRQAKRWLDAGLGQLPIAVNLSALQFRRGDVLELVSATLERTGLPAACLELELTESVLLQDVETTMTTLHALKALGVRLSIDDFGTGYSSLSYLKQLAVDKLKIDQSFVRDLLTDPDDASIVHAIIQLGHALQLLVIAEGVEEQAQLHFLREHGCDEVQGYLFSRPVPAEQFAALLGEAPLQNSAA